MTEAMLNPSNALFSQCLKWLSISPLLGLNSHWIRIQPYHIWMPNKGEGVGVFNADFLMMCIPFGGWGLVHGFLREAQGLLGCEIGRIRSSQT